MSPIKPENRDLYPPDWPDIRAEVLERAGHRCEWCGKPDSQRVAVGLQGEWRDPGQGWQGRPWGWFDELGQPLEAAPPDAFIETPEQGLHARIIFVRLTIAHLDHDPTNNGRPGHRPNLAALCQRCHLRQDIPQHRETARLTRARRVGQGVLF